MMLAQQLYEGIELGDEGAVGLITYMRTDAVRIAAEAQEEAREWVTRAAGPRVPARHAARVPGQEERAGGPRGDPARARSPASRRSWRAILSKDQLALYRLIWERFLASQMLPAVYDTVAADIEAGTCLFRAQGSTLKFAGFMAVYVESREETDAVPEEEAESVVPPARGRRACSRSWRSTRSSTSPSRRRASRRPRWSRLLEERGIGRPSTYAQILVDDPGPRLRPARAGHAVPHRARHAGQRPARARTSPR